MASPIHIATRKSPLAMRQAELVLEWLGSELPTGDFTLLPLSTQVDERLNWSLEKRGGLGLFTKELEAALLDERAGLAVHSAKDLPTKFENDLQIAGYLPRARANDVLVRRAGVTNPARIASSSPRRRTQIGRLYPEAEWTTIRGNVGTRLHKVAAGEDGVDASILAAAGLDRLDISGHTGLEFMELAIESSVPAPGQAAIAIQCRGTDLPRYASVFCPVTKLAVTLERAFLRALGGGCQTPVGAHYDGASFHVFHPNSGYRCFPGTLDSEVDIEPFIEAVIQTLGLAS